jgi:hypothetical protein
MKLAVAIGFHVIEEAVDSLFSKIPTAGVITKKYAK